MAPLGCASDWGSEKFTFDPASPTDGNEQEGRPRGFQPPCVDGAQFAVPAYRADPRLLPADRRSRHDHRGRAVQDGDRRTDWVDGTIARSGPDRSRSSARCWIPWRTASARVIAAGIIALVIRGMLPCGRRSRSSRGTSSCSWAGSCFRAPTWSMRLLAHGRGAGDLVGRARSTPAPPAPRSAGGSASRWASSSTTSADSRTRNTVRRFGPRHEVGVIGIVVGVAGHEEGITWSSRRIFGTARNMSGSRSKAPGRVSGPPTSRETSLWRRRLRRSSRGRRGRRADKPEVESTKSVSKNIYSRVRISQAEPTDRRSPRVVGERTAVRRWGRSRS